MRVMRASFARPSCRRGGTKRPWRTDCTTARAADTRREIRETTRAEVFPPRFHGGRAAALPLTLPCRRPPPPRPPSRAPAGFVANQTWSQTSPTAATRIALSSPNVANLDGQPAVVVGDRAGYV